MRESASPDSATSGVGACRIHATSKAVRIIQPIPAIGMAHSRRISNAVSHCATEPSPPAVAACQAFAA